MAGRKPLTEEQKEHKREYDNNYNRNNMVDISLRLNRIHDEELIKVYKSIPNKREWLRQCLREYAEMHPEALKED